MNRPLYESNTDLNNEQYVAQKIGAVWGCEFKKSSSALSFSG